MTRRPHTAVFRFYAGLGDFLPPERRGRPFDHAFDGTPSVKDAVESLGVPHCEVDLILVNGRSVGFDHRLRDGDVVSVYPVFESLDVSPRVRLRPAPLREPRFVADVHLGRLARALRLLGFDTAWSRTDDDAAIVARSAAERRAILTRDRGLLKRRGVTHGYWVRGTAPRAQVAEVLDRFDLRRSIRPFTRCSVCNGEVETLDGAALDAARRRAPERVRAWCREFRACRGCGRIYWEGAHMARLRAFVDWARSGAGPDA